MGKIINTFSLRVLFAALAFMGAFGLNAQIGPTGGTFTTCSGTFTDPGGAGNYANNANITYTIQPTTPATERTAVTFTSLSTELDFDFLRIFDGPTSASPLLTNYSGTQNGGSFTITASQTNASGALTFVFTSDASVAAAGWNATVACVPVASAPSSFIQVAGAYTTTDAAIRDVATAAPFVPNAIGYYGNSQTQVLTICAPSAAQLIRATFSQLQTESGFDFLTVFDGNSTAAPVIFGPSSGNTLPPVLTAGLANTTGCLTFRFTSDASVIAPGFLAQISALARPVCNLVLPANVTLNNTPGICGRTITNTALDATQNGGDCNPATLVNNFTNTGTLNGATLPVGITTIRWSVTSTGGIVLSGTFNVTVIDNEKPAFVACPASPVIVNLNPGECNRVLTFNLAGTDNCGSGTLVARQFSQNNLAVEAFSGIICGTGESLEYLRVFTNTGADDLRVSSVDAGVEAAPAGRNIVARIYRLNGVLNNANLTLLGSGTFTTAAALNLATINIPVGATVPAGSQFVVGVTYPDDASIAGFSTGPETGPSFVRGCASLGFLAQPTNLDNFGFSQSFSVRVNGASGNLLLVQNSVLGSGSTFPVGINPVSYRYTDAGGNFIDCIFNVDVRPFNNPASVKCNDNIQISLDEDCSVTIGADDILEGGPYKCYDFYLVQVDRTAPFNNGPWQLGVVTGADAGRTLGVRVVDDLNRNGIFDQGENSCWGSILVEDKLPPVLTCPALTVPCNADVRPGAPVTLPLSFVSASISIPSSGTVAGAIPVALPPGSTVVGLKVSIVTNHTWVGDISLDITGPNGVTRRMFDRPGNPATFFGCAGDGLNVTFDDNAATAASVFESTCGNNPAIAGTFQPVQSIAPLTVGASNGAWTATIIDAVAGDLGTATITLEFLVATTVQLPNNLFLGAPNVVQNGPQSFVVLAGRGTPQLDNCSNVTLSYIDSKADLNCPNPFTSVITRKWTAVDASGRSSTCNQTINLRRPSIADIVFPPNYDGISAPFFNCTDGNYPSPAYIERLGLQGFPYVFGKPEGCSMGWEYVDLKIAVCDGTYKIRRKWTAIDWCTSQEREFSQIIKVVDNTGPVLACDEAPAPGAEFDIRADGSDAGNAPDTFRVFRRAVAPLEGGIFQRIQNGVLTGNQQNTIGFYTSVDFNKCCATVDMPDFIVSDACSRVNDISAMIIGIDPLTNTPIGMFTVDGSIGNFPGNNRWVPDTMAYVGKTTCLPIGTHDVTYMVTDDCGNTTTCAFKLFILDEKPPIVAADEFTEIALGYNDPEDCYPGSPADSLNARNNCERDGIAWIPARNFDDGSYDNCGPIRFTIRRMADTTLRVGAAFVDVYSEFIESLNKRDGCVICDPDDDFLFSTDFTRTITDPFDLFLTTQFKPTEYQRAIFEQDSIKFYCDEVGTWQTVILRVYQVDDNGRPRLDRYNNRVFNEAMVQVYVTDKIKPTCVAPANVVVNCENFDPSLWAYGQARPDDNCCLDCTKVYQGVKGITHTANFNLFDTVCNKGTIIRTFTSYDCNGNTSRCTQRVIVTYKEDYYVRFPDDRIITKCDGTGNYGAPTFFGEDCELLATSFRDDTFTVVPDACFKIERHWKIINWCTYDPNCPLTYIPNPNPNPLVNSAANLPGPTVSNIDGCLQANALNPWRSACIRITPVDPSPTSYTAFWQLTQSCPAPGNPTRRHFNGYEYLQIIKIIDTEKPTAPCVKPDTCDLTENDPAFWNRDYWWDARHGSHNLCEMPIDLKLTATDACSGPNVGIRYLLFLDLDNNGTMETVINSIGTPPVNTVFFGNAFNPNYTGGEARAFDHRIVNNPALDWYRFAIQYTTSGSSRTAAVRFNTVRNPNTFVLPQLPHGKHKIKWIYDDGCGNENVCEYPFEIRDCKKPTIVCKPLSVNIMQTGMVQLWASDFLEYAFDNCTPADQLKIAVSTGTTPPAKFPRDANGNPITNVTFTCQQLGANVIQLWAEDKEGNADFCQVILLVQDNMSNCVQKATVAGELKTEAVQGVQDGNVELRGSHPAALPINLFRQSGQTGKYEFSNAMPILGNYTVTPVLDANPLNGVTTLDLALISKHILNLEPLNSPYKMIAADANKSGTITTLDIVALRRLILGIDNELSNNNSWRFVDRSYVFPNAQNPFSKAFPETRTVAQVLANQMGENFVGVKIGDVNGTATANNLMQADDRTVSTLMFDVEDRKVNAGELVEVKFRASERVTGYQFTLNHAGLAVSEIVPGAGMGMDNFAVFASDNAITTSFDGSVAGEFTVKFRATQAGQLSRMLGVSSRITKAMAYSESREQEQVAFRFSNNGVTTIAGLGFELYQNQPNPFVSNTMIGFHLPEAAKAILTVYDETGRQVVRREGDFAKGYNHFALDRELISTVGLLFYTVETSKDSATKKMIQSK